MATAQPHALPDGTVIRILHPVYFLATKFCALQNRVTDLRLSNDWEDIVYVLEERPEVGAEVRAAAAEVRAYLATGCAAMLAQPNLEELFKAVMSRGGRMADLKNTLLQLASE